MSIANITEKQHKGGRKKRLSTEQIEFIADKVSLGMPLKYALALLNPPRTVSDFEGQLIRSGKLSGKYQKRLAENLEKRLVKINDATCRTLPSDVWLLERRMPEYFSTRAANVSAKNAVIVIGNEGYGQDLLERAGRLAKVAQQTGSRSRPRKAKVIEA